MNKVEAFSILEINANEQLNKQMLEKAYKAAALRVHPDKVKIPNSATAEEQEKIKATQTEKFKNVREAYKFLLDTLEEKYKLTFAFHGINKAGERAGPVFSLFLYTNESELQTELELLFDQLKSNKNITAVFISSNKLPERLRRMIIDEIIKNKNIEKTKIIGGFLSSKENNELNNVMRQRELKGNLRVIGNLLLHPGYVAGIVVSSILISMFTILPLIASIAVGVMLNLVCMTLREEYLEKSEKNYSHPDDFDKVSSPAEKEALKVGVEAKHWRGYFSSYLNYSAYKHPTAFAAGMNIGLKEDEVRSSKIKML